MKNYLVLLSMLCAFGTSKAQPVNGDSTFHYLADGSKTWYYMQRDVAFFRMAGGAAFSGTTPACVTSVTHMSEHPDGYNKIVFDTSATDFQIQAENYYLNGLVDFEYGMLAMTHEKYMPHDSMRWYMPSDEIIVIFKEPTDGVLVLDDIEDFMTRNNLTVHHAPSGDLPKATYGWAWGFKLNGEDRFLPFDKCQKIFENETMVYYCEPDMELYKPTGCEVSPEMTANAGGSLPDALWHIRNQGNAVRLNPISLVPKSGTSGADANICECWDEGYHGESIKIAISDRNGYDYNHPDMTGQFLGGFDFISNSTFNATTYNPPADLNDHGMRVSSVVAALANAGAGTKAVGVAYASKIIPYLHAGTSLQIMQSIQRAVTDGAHVFNMSFGTTNNTWTQSDIYTQIFNATQVGRSSKGIIFVAGTGNENANARVWPAMDDRVIGVGATTPDDVRATPQTWFWNGGSNYYNATTNQLHYDVVAPGTAMMLATTDRSTNPATQTNVLDNATSYATPVVSGIAAIILSQYPNATYDNVINMIDGNAAKVGGNGYAQTSPTDWGGYNNWMFYGRVDCMASLSNPETGLKEAKIQEGTINFAYLNKDENAILFSKNENTNGSLVKIYDISGRTIDSKKVEAGNNTFFMKTEYSAGVYIVKVVTNNNTQATFKLIK